MKFTAAVSTMCLASAAAFAPAANVGRSTALFSGNPFDGPSLQYTGGSDPNNANYVKLSDALNEADTERRKAAEAADQREPLLRSVVKNARRRSTT